MGKVLLIGGSPMIGKSTLSILLAGHLRCHAVSTDDIGEVLQTVVPINPMQGMDYREYYANTAAKKLTEDVRQYHDNIWPAIERLIEIHSTWGSSLILEGYALYPRKLQPLIGKNVSACWLIAGEGLLESRLKAKTGFLHGAAAENYLLRSKWQNDELKRQCDEFHAHRVVIHGEEAPERLAREILNLMNL